MKSVSNGLGKTSSITFSKNVVSLKVGVIPVPTNLATYWVKIASIISDWFLPTISISLTSILMYVFSLYAVSAEVTVPLVLLIKVPIGS